MSDGVKYCQYSSQEVPCIACASVVLDGVCQAIETRQYLPLSAVHTPPERMFGSIRYHGYHLLGETELSETTTHSITCFIPSSYIKEERDIGLGFVLLWFGKFSKLTQG